MKRSVRSIAALAVLIFALSVLPSSVLAYNEEDGPARVIKIRTADDLIAMKDHPCSSFRLENDIDMKGSEWVPFAFAGTFDGRGHAVMNVDVRMGSEMPLSVTGPDGKPVEVMAGGFFTYIEGAQIRDLQLLGVTVSYSGKAPVFMGTLAGCSIDSGVENCIISGNVSASSDSSLTGTGGVFGYAVESHISNCDVSALLTVSGKAADHTSTVFAGGLLSFGFCGCYDNIITLSASALADGDLCIGGAVGMSYAPSGRVHYSNNRITGTLNYRNVNGSGKTWRGSVIGRSSGNYNTYRNRDFTSFRSVSDEKFRPSPHAGCSDPDSFSITVEPRPGRAGYTIDLCSHCNYVYKHDYTAPLGGAYINPAYKNWQYDAEGKTDLLVVVAHADDDQLFFAGILTYYAMVRDLNVQVLYGFDHYSQRGRHTERENGLWGVGVTNHPESAGYHDCYSESLSGAVSNLRSTDGKNLDDVALWYRDMILKYRPQVVITHDIYGEYGHGQHRILARGLQLCMERYADEFPFLSKAYLHYGSENVVTVDAIDERFGELNGRTPFMVAQDFGYAEHYSQQGTRHTAWLYGSYRQIRRADGLSRYSPLYWSLIWGDPSLDEHHNDIFEGLTSYYEQAEQKRLEEERIAREEEEKRLAEEKRIREEREAAERAVTENKALTVIGIAGTLLLAVFIIDLVKMKKKKKKRRKSVKH